MFILNRKKLKLLFFALLVFCFIPNFGLAYVPKIYIPEMKIKEITDNQIKGEFTIWNSEDYYFGDVNYSIKLYEGVDFYKKKLIDVKIPEKEFSVSSGAKITKSFVYSYPKNITDGSYTFRIQIVMGRGIELAWEDRTITLSGENKFLNIFHTSSRILIGTEESFPLTGVNVSQEEDVFASLKIENPGKAITVIPNIKIFKRQFNMPLVKEYQENPITFTKGETKDIKLAMPKFDIPESYLAEVKFLQNNEQVSGIQYFRWVVKGQGGKILYVRIDSDNYKKGDEMNIIIDAIGPADLTAFDGVTLEISVFDQNEKNIYKTYENVNLTNSLESYNFKIPIERNLYNPTVEVKISKDGKIFDERVINISPLSDNAKKMEKQQKRERILLYILILSVIIILIILFVIFKIKIKKR